MITDERRASQLKQGDLSTCDREPIHIPGSIQPHGVLFSLGEADLGVLQANANAAQLFGREFDEALRTPQADRSG